MTDATVRPRGAAVTGAILSAARELIDQNGLDSLTAEGVAARAGVGKTTVYRRWPNVWALVVDAFLEDVSAIAPITEGATVREGFRASMRSLVRAYRGPTGQLLRAVIGRAQVDDVLREEVRNRWVEPRRDAARDLVRRGIESGELRDDLDVDVVLDTLYGPIYHRILVPYNGADLTDAFVDAIVDHVFGGLERP
ncbi:TetR/AcrR family transcriptional regulator [Mycobacterium sp. GA-2829]|uniref:TetR/AcrR family transcriptional regulator n=1 Tax=Mycobacterium sp. GA-2829 TaxID=1772283 RepID=UPI00073FF087|nr:TetR/AcrR family transcriptional regulator [Mycobacterium sp. GA-2829]KUI28619.1 TetR family transcriptional regulator [Mycobacterium sp. GA-2829]